jgi:DNA adenine methylase
MALGSAVASARLASASQGERLRPIVKWAGGKARLLPAILPLLPERIETYYEPFVGGGAVFFALASERRFRRAVLSDLNAELVDVYRGIKKDVDAVIRLLERYRKKHDAELYYRTRELQPQSLELVERAARLIYLNKTGYNGLYRVNRAGQFNVPFGRYVNPAICDAERLRATAAVLRARGIKLVSGDFARVTEPAQPGDAVYFDPPYAPRSITANFTSYNSQEFGQAEHERLASTLEALTQRGVRTVLSNSDTRFTRQLYDRQRFQVQKVLVARPINSKSSKRGRVGELLIDNARAVLR